MRWDGRCRSCQIQIPHTYVMERHGQLAEVVGAYRNLVNRAWCGYAPIYDQPDVGK